MRRNRPTGGRANGETSHTIPWQTTYLTFGEPDTRTKRRLTACGIALSVVLVALKGLAGWLSGSTAVISDALNSVLDVFSYTALFMSVRLQNEPADLTHHYGHHRAEPLAGFLVAILAAVLGGVILRDAFMRLIAPEPIQASTVSIGIVAFAIASKVVISTAYRRAGRKTDSPALEAAAVDSRNDALASSVALIGLVGGGIWDSVAGLAIGAWIIYSGGRVGLQNIGFLMGKAPSEEVLAGLGQIARDVPGVLGTNNIRAHYVGNFLHAEIHIEVDERLSIREAHDLAKVVGKRLEQVEGVYVVFVHTDPVSTTESHVAGMRESSDV